MNQSPVETALSRAMIRWSLSRTEPVDETASNWLFLAEQEGRRTAAVSILKPEAPRAAWRSLAMLNWYGGEGAVAVYDIAGDTALMEWVDGTPLSLPDAEGRGPDAAIAVATVIAHLHARRAEPAPTGLVPLREHLSPILDMPAREWPASARDLLVRAQAIGRQLFDAPDGEVALHGNLGFDTIISSERGWLATAPLGLIGEPTWDAATIFVSPADNITRAAEPARIADLAGVLAPRLALSPRRLLGFAIAAAGRSTALSLAESEGAGPLFSLMSNLLAAHAQA